MCASNSRWRLDWRELAVKSASVETVENIVNRGSIPAFSFYFMLATSAVIATLGLLANSAAVVIGAMIVAPLMSPIIAFSYGLISGTGPLIIRSLLMVSTGTALTIGVAFSITELIGWQLAGPEIAARMRPTLLDLGIAVAAGAAAAFAYTRPGVSSALAGIAIAVALVPPLCTVGIAMAFGQDVIAEVGLAFDAFSPRGPLLLYLTNFIGTILASGVVFFWQYHRRRVLAVLTLALILGSLLIVVPPLGISMDNLLIRNQVYRNLNVISRSVLPADFSFQMTNLSVQIAQEVISVRVDIIAPPGMPPGLITPTNVNAIKDQLSDVVQRPVDLEFGIVHQTILHSM